MATYSYNSTYNKCNYIYRATGGGTVFSANLSGAVFDYFSDTAVVNDAIYFSANAANIPLSNLIVNVGTALAGTGITGVWEYSKSSAVWEECHDITDPTAGFTITGLNTIVFPLQADSYVQNINGISRCWVRYRLTAITSITEGGANQTTAPTCSDGKLTVVGGTDASPGTFQDMYDWVIVNAPEIDASNPAPSIFKFNNVRLDITSRLLSKSEQIFIGNGSLVNHNLSYLQSGTKNGTDGWSTPSCFFFCNRAGGNILTSSSETKMYGAILGGFTNYVNGASRVPGGFYGIQEGEWIGCVIQGSSGYFAFSTGYTMNKCTVPGNLVTSSFPEYYPTNMRVSNTGTQLIGLYAQGGTIAGMEYPLPTNYVFYFNQYGGESATDPNTINMVNCTNLPEQTDTIKAAGRRKESITNNLTKVFYYDASAGTYTNYTTQASNDTADDVPLTGDVGDIYYFNYSAVVGAYLQIALSFVLTSQLNDYEYEWEYYKGSWASMNTWDTTDNFTTSGRLYPATRNNWASTTINGTAGYWIRLRITKKGTASPKFTRVYCGLQTGIGDWRIYEKKSYVFSIIDEAGNAINEATVCLSDTLGTVTSLTTDVNGLTTSTDFPISVLQFDPNESDDNYNILKTNLNPYTITISKSGYKTYTTIFDIKEEMTMTITLSKVKDLNFSKHCKIITQ